MGGQGGKLDEQLNSVHRGCCLSILPAGLFCFALRLCIRISGFSFCSLHATVLPMKAM